MVENQIYKYQTTQVADSEYQKALSFDFENQSTLEIVFMNDRAPMLLSSTNLDDSIDSILRATKFSNQIEISILDRYQTQYIITSLDAEYSLKEMLLGANSRISYADGKFTLDSTKQATSLMATSTENDAMLLSLSKGKFELSASSNDEEEKYITYDASLSSKSWRATYVTNDGETANPTELTIKNIIFKNFQCAYDGGAIKAGANTKLNISNSQFISCNASNGGAIFAENSTVEINNSSFSNCSVLSSSGHAGALNLVASTAQISDSTFDHCTVNSSFNGGAVYAENQSDLSLTNCIIKGCNRGAIAIENNSTATISGGLFGSDDPIDAENPQYSNIDGVINAKDSTLTLNDVTIKQNYSSSGGTINSVSSSVTINGGTISNNRAENGGAIYATDSNLLIDGTQISNNIAGSGSAIYYVGDEEYTLNITNATISDNQADSQGTIYNDGGVLVVQDTTISNNTATGNGGAIYNTGTLEIVSSENSQTPTKILNNIATNGGAIYNNSNGTATIVDVEISNNTATDNGGAIYNKDSAIIALSSITFAQNGAGTAGAIYNSAVGASLIFASDCTFNNNYSTNTTYGYNTPDVYLSKDSYISLGRKIENGFHIYKSGLTSFDDYDKNNDNSSYIAYSPVLDYLSDENISVDNLLVDQKLSTQRKNNYLVCEWITSYVAISPNNKTDEYYNSTTYGAYVSSPGTFNGSTYKVVSRDYMFTDAITINVWASMDNWSLMADTSKAMTIYSCTEYAGWNLSSDDDGNVCFTSYSASKTQNSVVCGKTWANLESGWHMFTFTFDGKYARGYIDGELYGRSAEYTNGQLAYHDNNSIIIGAEASSSDTAVIGFFTGQIQGFTIVNESFYDQEIAKIFTAGRGKLIVSKNYQEGYIASDPSKLGYTFVEWSHSGGGSYLASQELNGKSIFSYDDSNPEYDHFYFEQPVDKPANHTQAFVYWNNFEFVSGNTYKLTFSISVNTLSGTNLQVRLARINNDYYDESKYIYITEANSQWVTYSITSKITTLFTSNNYVSRPLVEIYTTNLAESDQSQIDVDFDIKNIYVHNVQTGELAFASHNTYLFGTDNGELSAQYTPNIYKITLDHNGDAEGDNPTATINELYYRYETPKEVNGSTIYYYLDAECTQPITNGEITPPTKTSYVFKGYFTEVHGNGTQYISDTGEVSPELINHVGDITLYGHWVKGAVLHTDWRDKIKTAFNLDAIKITSIAFTNVQPQGEYCSVGAYDVDGTSDYSSASEYEDAFAYVSGTDVVFYSSYLTFAPQNSSNLFASLTACTSITFDNFNTSNVTAMITNYDTKISMFSSCSALTSLDVSGFDIGKTDKSVMNLFRNCTSLKQIKLFDTTNVVNMNGLFYGCLNLTTLNWENFKTDNVTDFNWAFYKTGFKSLDFSELNTDNITTMKESFCECYYLESIDLSNFVTKKVTNLAALFAVDRSLKNINLTGWDTQNVTNMSQIFYGCTELNSLDLTNLNTQNVTNMSEMFYNCSSLTSLDISSFNTSSVKNMSSMFGSCSALTKLDFSNFNTSNVATMGSMFSGCIALTELNFSKLADGTYSESFVINSGTNTSNMFTNCPAITTIYAPGIVADGVEVELPVTPMYYHGNLPTNILTSTHQKCKLSTISVTPKAYLLKTWKDVLQQNGLYADSITSISFTSTKPTDYTSSCSVGAADFIGETLYPADNTDDALADVTAYITDQAVTFYSNATIYAPQDSSSLFWDLEGCKSLTFDNFNTTNVTNMSCMFKTDGATELTNLDLSNWDTSSVTNMYRMFSDCSSLTELDVSNFDTSKVTNMGHMFNGIPLTSLDVSNFNTQNVTSMKSMFYGTSLTSLDLSNFDTSNVTDMDMMFSSSDSLTSLDLSSFKTQNVKYMNMMFSSCSALTSLDISNFDTQNVTNMSTMFSGCSSLTELNLSYNKTTGTYSDTFVINSDTDVSWMLSGCKALTSLYTPSSIAEDKTIDLPITLYEEGTSTATTSLTSSNTKKHLTIQNITYYTYTIKYSSYSGNISTPTLSLSTTSGILSKTTLSKGESATLTAPESSTSIEITVTALGDSAQWYYIDSKYYQTTRTYTWTPTSNATNSLYIYERSRIRYYSNGILQTTDFPRYGSSYTISYTPASRTGYTFDGYWDTSSGASTKVHYNGKSITVSQDLDLYAIWTASSSSSSGTLVMFDANGGSVNQTSKTVTGSTYGTLPTPNARSGYVFDGWYTSKTGGTKVTSSSALATSNQHTLYAHWVKTITLSLSQPSSGSWVASSTKYVYYINGSSSSNATTIRIDATLEVQAQNVYKADAFFNSAGTGEIGVAYKFNNESSYSVSWFSSWTNVTDTNYANSSTITVVSAETITSKANNGATGLTVRACFKNTAGDSVTYCIIEDLGGNVIAVPMSVELCDDGAVASTSQVWLDDKFRQLQEKRSTNIDFEGITFDS